jgi:16S rRNA (guanine966-N2)-methyltransferase
LRSGKLRVIAGTLKGRRLHTPSWEGLRPTSDKLRETLFNILATRVGGARVMDVYAGTGAIGIEALSRGAAHVTFVERDRRAQALIRENLDLCGIENGYVIIPASAAEALGRLAGARDEPFDIVLLDPPYETARDRAIEPTLAGVAAQLAPQGIVVLERARRHPAPDAVGSLVRTRDVISGDSALTFYEVRP